MHASKHSTTHLSFHPPIQIHHPPFSPTFHSSTFLPSPPFVHLSELHPAIHLPSCCVFNLWVHLCPRKTILPRIHLPIHLSIHSAYLLHAGSGAPLPQISCGSAAPSPPNHTKKQHHRKPGEKPRSSPRGFPTVRAVCAGGTCLSRGTGFVRLQTRGSSFNKVNLHSLKVTKVCNTPKATDTA